MERFRMTFMLVDINEFPRRRWIVRSKGTTAVVEQSNEEDQNESIYHYRLHGRIYGRILVKRPQNPIQSSSASHVQLWVTTPDLNEK